MHRGQGPPSLQQTVVNKLLCLTTSRSVESHNTQLLQMLLERELCALLILNNFNISLAVKLDSQHTWSGP